MIDGIGPNQSVRRKCIVLGFRRQSYYRRKQGHRPEELDAYIAELLHQVTKRFIAWGFWMVFHNLRRQGHPWNHKRSIGSGKQKDFICVFRPRDPKSGENT